jgi:hypothetical protein
MPADEGNRDELDALVAAISEAIEALVAWNVDAFQSAVKKQQEICAQLALSPPRPCAAARDKARKVRELNRVYEHVLRHSIRWTRTMQSILRGGESVMLRRSSMHFQG